MKVKLNQSRLAKFCLFLVHFTLIYEFAAEEGNVIEMTYESQFEEYF